MCIRDRIKSEDVVVISGAGTLGLGMITYASRLNPEKLIVLDIDVYKSQQLDCDGYVRSDSGSDVYVRQTPGLREAGPAQNIQVNAGKAGLIHPFYFSEPRRWYYSRPAVVLNNKVRRKSV